MSRFNSKRIQLIKEIMQNNYIEERRPEYIKYSNENFDILKHKGFYMVVDKSQSDNINVYNNLENAHRHIVKCMYK